MLTSPLYRPLAILTLIIALPAFGQRPSRSGIGLKVGPQMSQVHMEGASHDPALGAVLGMYAPVWSANRFEIQPELLFAWQGSSFPVKDGGTAELRSYHVQIPIVAKLFVSNALNFQFGGQMSNLLKAEITYDGEKQDVTENYRSLEGGLLLGVGTDLMSGLDLTARYYSGLTSLTSDETLNLTYRTIQFTVGYRFWRWTNKRVRKRL